MSCKVKVIIGTFPAACSSAVMRRHARCRRLDAELTTSQYYLAATRPLILLCGMQEELPETQLGSGAAAVDGSEAMIGPGDLLENGLPGLGNGDSDARSTPADGTPAQVHNPAQDAATVAADSPAEMLAAALTAASTPSGAEAVLTPKSTVKQKKLAKKALGSKLKSADAGLRKHKARSQRQRMSM